MLSRRPTPAARPDRANKRVLAGHLDDATFRRFKVMGAKLGWSTQAMVSYMVYLMLDRFEGQEDAVEASSLSLPDDRSGHPAFDDHG